MNPLTEPIRRYRISRVQRYGKAHLIVAPPGLTACRIEIPREAEVVAADEVDCLLCLALTPHDALPSVSYPTGKGEPEWTQQN